MLLSMVAWGLRGRKRTLITEGEIYLSGDRRRRRRAAPPICLSPFNLGMVFHSNAETMSQNTGTVASLAMG